MEPTHPGAPGPAGSCPPHVSWITVPPCRHGVLLAAFEGWNDAGDAATTAVGFLARCHRSTPFASVDPDDFFDFTINRPEVRIVADGRRLEWPETRLSIGRADPLDLVLLEGIEPHLRWRTFCEEVLAVASALGVRRVVTLGALLAEVPHTRAVPVYGATEDPALADRLGLEVSTYEGPTGIVGVLGGLAAAAGFETASFWAAVPTYASGVRSPKAALALVDRIGAYLGIRVPTVELEIAAAAYERQVSSLVEEDEETAEWVTRLEEDHDREQGELSAAGALVEEVERFLRSQED